MPRIADCRRNKLLSEISAAVRSGQTGWTLEEAGSGKEIAAVEVHLRDMDPSLRGHENFEVAADLIREAFRLARSHASRGRRSRPARPTSSAGELAREAASALGLEPPDARSMQVLAARGRRKI